MLDVLLLGTRDELTVVELGDATLLEGATLLEDAWLEVEVALLDAVHSMHPACAPIIEVAV